MGFRWELLNSQNGHESSESRRCKRQKVVKKLRTSVNSARGLKSFRARSDTILIKDFASIGFKFEQTAFRLKGCGKTNHLDALAEAMFLGKTQDSMTYTGFSTWLKPNMKAGKQRKSKNLGVNDEVTHCTAKHLPPTRPKCTVRRVAIPQTPPNQQADAKTSERLSTRRRWRACIKFRLIQKGTEKLLTLTHVCFQVARIRKQVGSEYRRINENETEPVTKAGNTWER